MRYVLHPLNAENYKRDKVYTELNFKHQVFQTGTAEKFDNIAYVGNNIGDKTVYNNALERIFYNTESIFFYNHYARSFAVGTNRLINYC